MSLFTNADWLPIVFFVLMGVAVLAYVILDGYDLGVGILMSNASTAEKDVMIASIGPFWDANETWLVLGVGILLVAFPTAYGVVLTALYLPVAIMLIGLILRGVAFDFRAKAKDRYKSLWDQIFVAGSLIAGVAQGYMLGHYVTGFEESKIAFTFAVLIGICLAAGYVFIGAAWLVMKTEAELQKKALRWVKWYLWFTALGIGAVSVVTPLISDLVFTRWFSYPNFLFLLPIPVLTVAVTIALLVLLQKLPQEKDRYCWAPFAGAVGLFVLAFFGLAYSFYPYVVPNQITIWQAPSAPESLGFILIGILLVLPVVIGYTVYAYRVFWGKVRDLRYD